MAEPRPWLRIDPIVSAVSEWTGVPRKDLLSPGGSQRIKDARFLLAFALQAGTRLSKREVLLAMGYSPTGGIRNYRIFRDVNEYEAAEIDQILKLARSYQDD